MKKFTKFLMAAFFSATVLTSCIDNTVSSGIEAIRQAQANLINAKAETEEANAAYQNALAAVQTANAAYRNAEAQSMLETVESQDIANQEALIVLSVNAANAEADLVDAEKALEEALDALADYLATQGLEDAEDYLVDYRDAMDEVYDYAGDIADQNETISELMKFMSAPGGDTYALLKERMERQLVLREAELAIAQEIRDDVAAVTGDASAAATLWATTEAEIQTLSNDYYALDVSIAEAENTSDAAWDVVDGLEETIDEYDELVEVDLVDAEDELADSQDQLADAEEAKTDAETEIATLEAQLAPLTTELTSKYAAAAAFQATATANFQSITVAGNALKVAIQQGIPANVTTKATAMNTAITTFEVTVGETNQDATAYATVNDVDNGLATLEGFIDNPVDKAGSTTDYESVLALYAPVAALFNAGQTGYNLVADIGKYNPDFFIGDFEDANGVIADIAMQDPLTGPAADLEQAEADIEDANEAIAEDEAVVAEVEAEIAALDAANTAAVAAIDAATDAAEAADDAVDALEDEQDAVDFEWGLKENLADALEAFVEDDVNAEVESWEQEVEDAKIAVAEAQEDIDQVDRDVAHAGEMLVREQAELEVLETELASWQALAAQYLALMNAAIGA